MSVSDYAEKIVDLINARPEEMDLDSLLYEIYVRAKLAEARKDKDAGHWRPHDEVMEEMWQRIHSKSAGSAGQKKTSSE